MKQEHIMAYARVERRDDGSEQLVEEGAVEGKAELIGEYRQAFLDSEICARHFRDRDAVWAAAFAPNDGRSEEHTSELQSLMRNSYAVFCLKKKTTIQ